MAAETQYTANTGVATISTANTNLNGSGTLGTILTADAGKKGVLIKTITVKAIVTTTQGVVRLFIYDGTNTKLITEVEVPAVVKSATVPSFEAILPLNFFLKAGWVLKASTEKNESFNIIAEGQDWDYNTNAIRADTTKYTVYNAAATMSSANSNLDGSGTITTIMGDVGGAKGCEVRSLTFKAKQTTTPGMIRVFIWDRTSSKLFREIPVPAITQSAITPTFYHRLEFPNGFSLKNIWQIKVATEKAEAFNIIPETLDLSYPA